MHTILKRLFNSPIDIESILIGILLSRLTIGFVMEIKLDIAKSILIRIRHSYPRSLGSDGYKELSDALGSDMLLDGYLLYLKEKGLIHAEMMYNRTEGGFWWVNTSTLRVSAKGIDWLM